MNSESTWHDYNNNGTKDRDEYYYCQRTPGQGSLEAGVECFSEAKNKLTGPLIAHELGHAYNAGIVNRINGGTLPATIVSPYSQLQTDGLSFVDEYGNVVILGDFNDPDFNRYYLKESQEYVFNNWNRAGEEFADLFANWVYGSFNLANDFGITRLSWIETRLIDDLSILFGIPPNIHPTNRCRPPLE